MNTIYVDAYHLVVNMWFKQVFMTWSNLNWSKEYTPFGPTDNHLEQSNSNGPSDLDPYEPKRMYLIANSADPDQLASSYRYRKHMISPPRIFPRNFKPRLFRHVTLDLY